VVCVGGGGGESQLSVVVVVVVVVVEVEVVVVVEEVSRGDGSAEPKRQDMVACEVASRGGECVCVDVVASRSDGACECESPCRGNNTLVYV
jgi:hypothetical protein